MSSGHIPLLLPADPLRERRAQGKSFHRWVYARIPLDVSEPECDSTAGVCLPGRQPCVTKGCEPRECVYACDHVENGRDSRLSGGTAEEDDGQR